LRSEKIFAKSKFFPLNRKKNILEFSNLFKAKYLNTHSYPKFKWLSSFFDHFIRLDEWLDNDNSDWHNHYDYTVTNHLKHNLPEKWPYTSMNNSL